MVELQNALLATTTIEWTDVPHTVDGRAEWFERQRALHNPVLVAVVADELVGWCTLSDFRDTTEWPATAPPSSTRSTFEKTAGGAESVGR
jgi:L-amino acid N-acyltransferase YncA